MRAVGRVLVVGDFLAGRVPVKAIASVLGVPERTVRTDVGRLAALSGGPASPPATFRGAGAWAGRERRVRAWRLHLGLSSAELVRQAVPASVWAFASERARAQLAELGRWPAVLEVPAAERRRVQLWWERAVWRD